MIKLTYHTAKTDIFFTHNGIIFTEASDLSLHVQCESKKLTPKNFLQYFHSG